MSVHVTSVPLLLGDLPLSLRFDIAAARHLQNTLKRNPLHMSLRDWILALLGPDTLPEILQGLCMPPRPPIEEIMRAIDTEKVLLSAQPAVLRCVLRFGGVSEPEIDERLTFLDPKTGSVIYRIARLSGLSHEDATEAAAATPDPTLAQTTAMAELTN